MTDFREMDGGGTGMDMPSALKMCSEQMAAELMRQPVYHRRAALYQEVMDSDEMRSLYRTYTQQKEKLQMRQAAGIEPTQEEVSALAAFGHLIGEHPSLEALILAEVELEGLVGQVLEDVMRRVMWNDPCLAGQ